MDPKRHWTALALVLGAGCTAHTNPPLDSSADALSGSDAIATDTIVTDTAATEGGLATPAARCAAITESIRASGFSDKVTVRCDERYAYIVSDTYPDHVKMTGITGTNDQVPVPAPGYTTPISLAPSRAAQPTSIDAALGVAVNGVPIYDYSSQGTLDLFHYDPRTDTKLTGELDQCNGHSGRGDDYHYHASPTCMIAAMRNRGDAAIIGWGFDGYPIFGNNNPDGTSISAGQLDVCNGQSDPVYGYRYHTSDARPYVLQCLTGAVDVAMAPRVAPLTQQGGGGRPPGEKPPGGVTNLQLVESPDGSRRMSYTHQGQTYYIAYRPSSTASCWDFDESTFTTRGVQRLGTYCRGPR